MPADAVRPHRLLDAIVTSPGPPKRLESKRCWNVGQNRRRKGATKSAQEMALVDVDRRHRYEAGNGGESRSDRLNATTQPTDGSGQADVGPANQIGSGFQALGRMRHGHALLNRVE